MTEKFGQDREGVKIRDALNRPAVVEHESVYDGPFDRIRSNMSVQPELDEERGGIAGPSVDAGAKIWQTTPDALEVCLCGRNTDHRGGQWLHEYHIGME